MVNFVIFMKPKSFATIACVLLATLPLAAQEKLYPVRAAAGVGVLVNSDRTAFSFEKAFQHKITLGAPEDDRMAILPDTNAAIGVFWVRLQNTSQRPLKVDVSTFSATDDDGKTFRALPADQAFEKMIADASAGSIGSKTLRGISLGRVGGKRTAEEIKEDVVRYSIVDGQIPGGSVREGFIFFEVPDKKKFRFNVTLGDIWGKPLVYSTEKQK